MNRPIRVYGHTDPTQGAPHDAAGRSITSGRTGMGRARCSCGALSPEALPSQAARQRWHRRHREALARVPWAR